MGASPVAPPLARAVRTQTCTAWAWAAVASRRWNRHKSGNGPRLLMVLDVLERVRRHLHTNRRCVCTRVPSHLACEWAKRTGSGLRSPKIQQGPPRSRNDGGHHHYSSSSSSRVTSTEITSSSNRSARTPHAVSPVSPARDSRRDSSVLTQVTNANASARFPLFLLHFETPLWPRRSRLRCVE